MSIINAVSSNFTEIFSLLLHVNKMRAIAMMLKAIYVQERKESERKNVLQVAEKLKETKIRAVAKKATIWQRRNSNLHGISYTIRD